MVNYKNSIIYKIYCNDLNIKEVYIGSTTNFNKRKINHKLSCNGKIKSNINCPVYMFINTNGGWDNWTMCQIKSFPCNTKKELHFEERKIIEQSIPNLNKSIPTRKQKEYYKLIKSNGQRTEWRKDYELKNKEKISERKKLYYLKNKEKIKQTQMEYYNKKKINII